MKRFSVALAIAAISICVLTVPRAQAQLDPEMRERIAAIQGEVEGVVLTEGFLRRREGTSPAAQARKKELLVAAAAADPYLDASVRKSPRNPSGMGIEGPVCFDAAPKFGMMLRAMGFPVHTVSTTGHVFLIADYPEGVFIVDPTFRQFLGQDAAPDYVPRIFVGGLSELAAIYERDPNVPVMPYRKIYFDSSWPPTIRDSFLVSSRDSFLWSPMNEEHAPLTAYFNAQARRRDFRRFAPPSLDEALRF